MVHNAYPWILISWCFRISSKILLIILKKVIWSVESLFKIISNFDGNVFNIAVNAVHTDGLSLMSVKTAVWQWSPSLWCWWFCTLVKRVEWEELSSIMQWQNDPTSRRCLSSSTLTFLVLRLELELELELEWIVSTHAISVWMNDVKNNFL